MPLLVSLGRCNTVGSPGWNGYTIGMLWGLILTPRIGFAMRRKPQLCICIETDGVINEKSANYYILDLHNKNPNDHHELKEGWENSSDVVFGYFANEDRDCEGKPACSETWNYPNDVKRTCRLIQPCSHLWQIAQDKQGQDHVPWQSKPIRL